MRYTFLICVFVVNGCTLASDFDGYTFAAGAAGAGGAGGRYWWAGAGAGEGGAAGGLEAGAGGAGGADAAGVAGAGGAAGAAGQLEEPDAGPELEDAAEPHQDAQQPVPDAGAPGDGGLDASPEPDAGEALGTQCAPCAENQDCAQGYGCIYSMCVEQPADGICTEPATIYHPASEYCSPTMACEEWLSIYGPDAPPLGTQCELCAVLGADGLFEDILECEWGYLCNSVAAGATEAYCLQRTFPGTPKEIECGEGLYEWPDSLISQLPRCIPVSGSCDLWLQEYGQ